MSTDVTDRFVRYCKVDTQSDPDSPTYPSSQKQFNLANMLVKELKDLGVSDATVSEFCVVSGTIPSNCGDPTVMGLIAHMDVSPDAPSANVNPQFHQITDEQKGKDLILSEDPLTMIPWSQLEKYVGDTIITSDGKTLLGADDKAGIAIIMTAVDRLLNDTLIAPPHPNIRVIFTPDEEIGRGTDKIDLEKMKLNFAYTVDGGEIGEFEQENFNAYTVHLSVRGHQTHPGTGKNILGNASIVVAEFIARMPGNKRPETTQDYEGFIHLTSMEGNVEKASADFIIRDFTDDGMENMLSLMKQEVKALALKYPLCEILPLDCKFQYANMKSVLERHPDVVSRCKGAYRAAGVVLRDIPIRGGTDGARLSQLGVPCPNIFAGGLNFHSKNEFVPVRSLVKGVDVISELIKFTKNKKETL